MAKKDLMANLKKDTRSMGAIIAPFSPLLVQV